MKVTVELPTHIFEAVKDVPFSAEDGVIELLELGYAAKFGPQLVVQDEPVIEFKDEPKSKKGKKDFTEIVPVEPDSVPVIDRADKK